MFRSLLFTPSNHQRRVEKALTESGADAVILDLEDAVAVTEKVAARPLAVAALNGPRTTLAYVRINAIDTPWFFGDLDAVVIAELDGIVLPKTTAPEVVYLADQYLTHLERERGLEADSVDLIPLIETAAGAANAREICAIGVRRVKRVAFGAGDFTVDLGFTWTPGENELLVVRTMLAIYARTAGLEAPIDSAYLGIHDHVGFEASTRRTRELGYQGRLCIHPAQIEPVHRIYSPTPEEIEWAEEVNAAFSAAEGQGIASIQVRGRLVDYPIARQAKHILQRAGRR